MNILVNRVCGRTELIPGRFTKADFLCTCACVDQCLIKWVHSIADLHLVHKRQKAHNELE